MVRINLAKWNIYTIISLLFLIAGISFYLFWVATYGVVYDIGIYALTIVLVLPGILGFILSVLETGEE